MDLQRTCVMGEQRAQWYHAVHVWHDKMLAQSEALQRNRRAADYISLYMTSLVAIYCFTPCYMLVCLLLFLSHLLHTLYIVYHMCMPHSIPCEQYIVAYITYIIVHTIPHCNVFI